MPYPLEFPRMLRAVVPLMRGQWLARCRRNIVHKLVALAFKHSSRSRGRFAWRCARLEPGLSAVIGPLDDLPEPAAGLRCIQSVRIRGRSLHVINLPARKMRPANFPLLALPVRTQNERALSCPHQHSDSAHSFLPFARIPLYNDRNGLAFHLFHHRPHDPARGNSLHILLAKCK